MFKIGWYVSNDVRAIYFLDGEEVDRIQEITVEARNLDRPMREALLACCPKLDATIRLKLWYYEDDTDGLYLAEPPGFDFFMKSAKDNATFSFLAMLRHEVLDEWLMQLENSRVAALAKQAEAQSFAADNDLEPLASSCHPYDAGRS